MPPRKSTQSPSVCREEAPKKKAKLTHSPSSSAITPSTSVPPIANFDFGLSADEKQFLAAQLAQFSRSAADKAPAPAADLSSSAWVNTLLPTIVSIAEKVLKAAAEQYAMAAVAASSMADEEGALSVAAPSNPAGTAGQFAEENGYILDQLRQLQWTPFTYQRLVEILANPCGACHCLRSSAAMTASSGKWVLRGDVLQAALRRCVLVNYPFSGEGDRSG